MKRADIRRVTATTVVRMVEDPAKLPSGRLRLGMMAWGLTTCSLLTWGLLATSSDARAQAADPAATKPKLTIQLPALPGPAPVKLAGARTAVLVADMVDGTCGKQPNCTGHMVPRIAALLAAARRAGAYVVYTVPREGAAVLPDVAPKSGEPTFIGHAQDRFWNTKLDDMLKAKRIDTLVLTGWKIDGSVLYTSVAATERGYTVVIPEDASLASTEYDVAIGHFQALTQLDSNPQNTPLKKRATTLSRTDMMTFD